MAAGPSDWANKTTSNRWPDPDGIPIEDSWTAMQRLVHEGKVRAARGRA
ncbi:MAG TPA: hypothetical protein VJ992_06230 [Gemmatimonadales bacterium]|nr:hypothetical protein [Gemmatimonadales bacterium]